MSPVPNLTKRHQGRNSEGAPGGLSRSSTGFLISAHIITLRLSPTSHALGCWCSACPAWGSLSLSAPLPQSHTRTHTVCLKTDTQKKKKKGILSISLANTDAKILQKISANVQALGIWPRFETFTRPQAWLKRSDNFRCWGGGGCGASLCCGHNPSSGTAGQLLAKLNAQLPNRSATSYVPPDKRK